MANEIINSYKDVKNPGAYTGASNFYKTNKFAGKKSITKELLKLKGYRRHTPANKKINKRFYYVPGIDNQFGVDLIDIKRWSKSNYNKKYIVAVMDFFSKRAWFQPISNKTSKSVLEAFEKILSRSGRKPAYLQADRGTEFESATFKKYCKDNNIKQFSVTTQNKVSFLERLIRTLFQRISRYMTENNTKRFIHKLQDFENGYNNSFHRSIGMTPASVNKENESDIWYKLYASKVKLKKKKSLSLGTKVNLKRDKKQFEKGYSTNFDDVECEVCEVLPTSPPTYRVKCNDELLRRVYYRQELVPIGISNDTEGSQDV